MITTEMHFRFKNLAIVLIILLAVTALAVIKSPPILAVHFTSFTFLLCLVIINYRRSRQRRSMNEFVLELFKNLRTGVVLIDDQQRILSVNPAAYTLLRIEQNSVKSEAPLSAIIHPLLEPIAERISAAIRSGEEFSREYRVFLNSGICCMHADFYSFNRIKHFKAMYVLAIEDITAQDDVRQKLSQQLEETHRYAQLKDNFFANMSHEIRTPINAILGMTYFLKIRETDEKSLEYVAKIENASELLLRVVNDILDFSKMNGNKFSLKPENFNLYTLRKVLLDLFIEKARQKGLDLHLEFNCPEIFYVYGDQFRLTQVFMNLISNAVKFTDRGFVSVSVNTETISKDVILRCTVRDTGCGISEEDLAKLFTEFEQFGEVMQKQHEGSGLGLAISKRLVELMHGVIWVDSSPGHGSSFHFVVVLGAPSPVVSESHSDANLPVIMKKTGIVLVVEDNEINSEIAAALLLEAGYAAEHAHDGLEAIERCRARPVNYYDLILMDIHMPRMNGYDTARVLKSEMQVECPIVAVSATSESNDILDSNRDVIAGYILKPYDPGVFRSLFAEV